MTLRRPSDPITTERGARTEAGAVAIMVVTSLLALVGFASLVVDVGLLYVKKQAHVNGCDAAAIAGAFAHERSTGLDEGARQGDAAAAARVIAAQNGLPGPVAVTFPMSGEIEVRSTEAVPLLFAPVFNALGGNHSTSVVGGRSTARFGSPNSVREVALRPLGIDAEFMATAPFGEEVGLPFDAAGPGGPIPGALLPLVLSPDDFGEAVKTGLPGAFRVGDPLPLYAGDPAAPTAQAVTDLLAQSQAAPWSGQGFGPGQAPPTLGNPRALLLPVVRRGASGGVIVGFAAFFVSGAASDPPGGLVGRFLNPTAFRRGDVDPDLPGGERSNLIVARWVG